MTLYALIPGGDFGISIIIFTILLRIAIHPLVRRQLHQTKAMRRLQPELEEIKRRTKNNRQLQGVQMMELYKKHGVSPFRSIGIVFIQLPIFIALYIVIDIFTRNRDELARWTYGFIENIGHVRYIVDNPDAFNEKLLGIVSLTQHAITGNNVNLILVLIAVIAAAGQFIQSKQTMPQPTNKRRLRDIMSDAANGKEADQSEINTAIMNKMIYMLPVFMLFVMLSLPGGIALYYAVTTIVAVIQQHFILREDEEELEEIASEHPSKKIVAKATKERVKNAKEASVTRIVAKGARPSKPKNRKGGKR